MAAVISLRPLDARGIVLLDELEGRTGIPPAYSVTDGTRRYYLDSDEADVDDFGPMLDRIDESWRDHVTRN